MYAESTKYEASQSKIWLY